MNERFTYDSAKIIAINLKYLPVFSIVGFGAAFYYFNRPYREEGLPYAIAIIVAITVLAAVFVVLFARKKSAETIVVDDNGVSQNTPTGENLITWEEISDVEYRQTGNGDYGMVVYVRAENKQAIKIYPYVKNEKYPGKGFTELYEMLTSKILKDENQ